MDLDNLTVLQSIDAIIENFINRREPISPKITLGTEAYREMQSELRGGYIVSTVEDGLQSYAKTTVYQSFMGAMSVEVSKDVPADFVGIGGRTVLDIVAEQILLEGDDEESESN